MSPRGLVVVAFLAAALPAYAAELHSTEVGPYRLESSVEWITPKRVNVRAEVTIPSYPARAWAVITDYENLAKFVPNITYSHLVQREPKIVLMQKGHLRVPPYFRPIEAVFEVEEDPPRTLTFHVIKDVRGIPEVTQKAEPDFLAYDGYWGIREVDGGVRLVYQATVEPSFWMPKWVTLELERYVMKTTFRAIIKRCLEKEKKP